MRHVNAFRDDALGELDAVCAPEFTVTGSGTAFTPNMVGSVMRISATVKPPTSLIMGGNVAVFESTIASYVSSASVVITTPADQVFTGVGYTVSDPIDIEQGAMLNAFHRCVEMHIGMSRTMKDKPSAANQYQTALSAAKCADSRRPISPSFPRHANRPR